MHVDNFESVKDKAHKINLDSLYYGSFAEIGAGQEVTRHFFRAGAASRTVAKAMSAYDMNFPMIFTAKKGMGDMFVNQGSIKCLSMSIIFSLKDLKCSVKHNMFLFSCQYTDNNKFADDFAGHGWMGVRFQKSREHLIIK
jgi:hypothetical protein